MLCTASILNLCCISLDRYFAITRPLAYTQLRSPKLARTMIALVWIVSLLISCPPVFGWKDERRATNSCSLNLVLSYRIYSSMGSFFIPCIIMIFVYIRIFIVIHNREKYLQKNSSYSTPKLAAKKQNLVRKTGQKELNENRNSSFKGIGLQAGTPKKTQTAQTVYFKKKICQNDGNEADQKNLLSELFTKKVIK